MDFNGSCGVFIVFRDIFIYIVNVKCDGFIDSLYY